MGESDQASSYGAPASASGGSGDLAVTPDQLRGWSTDCTERASELESQLGPAADACDALGAAAEGWKFAESIPEMRGRWQDINKFLRDELSKAAENFWWCADRYDENENLIVEYLRYKVW